MFNPFDMIQKTKKMQEAFKQVEGEFASLQEIGDAGAGMVLVTMNGHYDVLSVTIDDAAWNAGKAVVEEMVAAATRDAKTKVKRAQQEIMAKVMANLGLPANFSNLMMPLGG